MNVKFYKGSSSPQQLEEGSIFFNTSTGAIQVYNGTEWEYYGGILSADLSNNVLTLKASEDSKDISIDFSTLDSAGKNFSVFNTIKAALDNIETIYAKKEDVKTEYKSDIIKDSPNAYKIGDLTVGKETYNIFGKDNGVDKQYVDDSVTSINKELIKKANVEDLSNVLAEEVVDNNTVKEVETISKEELVDEISARVKDELSDVDFNTVLLDSLSYGVAWNDQTQSDPHLTRIGNMQMHKTLPIQSKYRGCVCKNNIVQYYLDPNDWSHKEDGTASILDGTDGDVYVETPEFYGKSNMADDGEAWVRISETRIDAT